VKIFKILFFSAFLIFLVTAGIGLTQKPLASLNRNNQTDNKFNFDKHELPLLTMESILKQDHSWVVDFPEDKIITLITTGDVLLARSVNSKTSRLNDFKWPFINVADVLRSADIAFINLETPLIENCSSTDGGMIFCGNQKNIEGLIFAGIDIVNVANNHMENYGETGVLKTANLLEENGIIVSGLPGSKYKNINGVNIAFLGYNDVGISNYVSSANKELIFREITEARNNADVVIVQFHWGEEYTTKISDRQKELAYLALDSGADLVIGNHPHWIQPIEIYKGKLITYSHGNFIFDQEWSEKTKMGIVGRYTFYDDQLIDAEFLPIRIEDYGQPYFLEGEEKLRILEEIYVDSSKL
jgi:gamma-polyglutamate biosynthesis protein CapA